MRLELMLRAQAIRYPGKIALICGDERISYAELERTIARLASGLRRQGVRVGVRGVLFLPNSTTGKPKGDIVTHSNIVTQHGFINAIEWDISHADRCLVTTPLAHRTGFARLGNALTLGGTLIIMTKFDPKQTIETIAREGVTVA